MNSKRITGIVFVAGAVCLFVFSNYIQGQVAEGREQIRDAQKTVDKGSSLFSLSPVTKDVGKGLFGGAQRKINEGRDSADRYALLAARLQIGAIVLFAAGVLVILFSLKKSRRKY